MKDYATDMLKNRVEIGDSIVCALTVYSSATLRLGLVTGFTDRADSYSKSGRKNLIIVKWIADSSVYGAPEESKIEAGNGRFLKITK